MSDLRISTVQTHLIWENRKANLSRFDQLLQPLADMTDLVVLPEMFTTGFSMKAAALAEPMDGPSVEWMARQAEKLRAVVTGSLIISEKKHYYNRLVWMHPNGQCEYYDKRHLFTLAKEQESYTAGTQKLIVDYKGWKICPLVCYDLRFPAWSRNLEDYDLLIYVANWPTPRRHHWQSLLVARAIENQCYVVGVNREGTDENGWNFSGDTAIIDYGGNHRYQVADTEAVFTSTLSLEEQQNFRQRFQFLPDRDDFTFR